MSIRIGIDSGGTFTDGVLVTETGRVGTDQSHISTEHTLSHFREENYHDLLNHCRYDDWYNGGASDLATRATLKVDEILTSIAETG